MGGETEIEYGRGRGWWEQGHQTYGLEEEEEEKEGIGDAINGGRDGKGAIQRRHAPSHNGGDYGW